MIVEVKAFSFLEDYLPDSDRRRNNGRWDLPDGFTVDQTLEMLHLPQGEPLVLLVNDRLARRESVLKDGDTLHIIPTVCGG